MQQYILSCNHCGGFLKQAQRLVQTKSQPRNNENIWFWVLEEGWKLLRISSLHVSLKNPEDTSFLTYFDNSTSEIFRLHTVTQVKHHIKNEVWTPDWLHFRCSSSKLGFAEGGTRFSDHTRVLCGWKRRQEYSNLHVLFSGTEIFKGFRYA